jgi:hypothetical protein
VLVVGHEILADQDPVWSDQIFHGMRHSMRAYSRSDVGVEDPKAADHGAIAIREQRKPDAVLIRKAFENFLGIITDPRDPDALRFKC